MAIITTTPSGGDATYQDEIGVIARDQNNLRNVLTDGAVGDGATDDSTDIQTTLDIGPGTVYIPYTGSAYIIGTMLTIPEGVHVVCDKGVIIEATTDIYMVRTLRSATWTGGRIYNSNAGFTKALALIKSTGDADTLHRNIDDTGFRDVTLRGPIIGQGYGLHLWTTSDLSRVQWTVNRNINIYNVSDAIRLECDEDSGELSYVNGNMITEISVSNCTYALRTVSSGTGDPTINGNHIDIPSIQTHVDMTRVVLLDANSRRNFIRLGVFDWSTSSETIAIETASTDPTMPNIFTGVGLGIDSRHVQTAVGGDDTFYMSRIPQRLPVRTKAILAATAADEFEGSVSYVSDDLIRCIAYSRGSTNDIWAYSGGINEIANSFTADSITLTNADMGEGVLYRADNASGGTAGYVLPDAEPGLEGIFRGHGAKIIRLTPVATDDFWDPVDVNIGTHPTVTNSAAVGLTANGKYIESAVSGIIHIKCIHSGHWIVVMRTLALTVEA